MGGAMSKETRPCDSPPPERTVAVEVTNITKIYGQLYAVQDLTLSVKKGEFVALLGPSGSGKTSVLMMIAGFTDPTRGDIRIEGRSMLGVPPEHRDIGVVFQNYALFPHLSVEQNISFPLEMRKRGRNETAKQVEEALNLVGLSGLGRRFPHQLSGGQQQRVALARALVFRPTLLLMDEPLGALDKQLRQQMQIELRSLHRNLGTTILYVTHDQQEALALANRVAVMREGKIVQVDQPAKLYREPCDQFVATFIGDCNLLAITEVTRMPEGWHVNVGGYRGVIPCDQSPGIPKGNSKIAVRPHFATISASGSSEGLSGILVDMVFMGETNEYVVEVPGKERFMVREIATRRSFSAEIGATVRVSWPWTETRIV
jgi:putative spermidine/putrescine transport system ATP-binding protein